MEDLPKIVRDRLAAPAPSDHPDADLLTAFSENALGPRERAGIVRHLAVCSFCREVNSLAAPQEEKAFAAAVGMAASPPLALARAPRSSSLRWGVLAAVAVILAAATWSLRPSHKAVSALPPQEVSSAKGDRMSDEIQLAQAKEEGSKLRREKQSTAPEQGARSDSAFRRLPEPAAASPSRHVASTSSAHIALGEQVGAPPPPTRELDGALAKMQTPAAPAPDRQSLGSIMGSAKTARVSNAAPALARQEREAQSEAKDKKTFAAAEVATGTGAGLALDSTVLNGFMRWTLSDGKLRRSTDAGVNWEVVPIDQNSVFRALSVLGVELWVGGKNGVLYHSPDNGKHWVHVVPTAGEELLTEDIVRLEFADADHGKLITPHSEWTTENCGATWHRLQR
jgi:hypothetical protein